MAANIGLTLGSLLVPELRNQVAQNLLGTLSGALLSGYGREHELEADRLGAEYLARSGYDPQAMVRVVGVLKNQELFDADIARQEGRQPRRYHGLFATHPDNDTRLKQVVGEAAQFSVSNPEEGRAAFLDRMNGVVFGDSAEQGMVRGNTFLHEGLDVALEFPEQWKIRNQADKVQAQNASGEAWLELTLIDKPNLAPADFLSRALKLDLGSEMETTSVHGLPAAIATGNRQGKPVTASVIYLKDKAYAMLGSAKSPAAFSRYLAIMHGSMKSFRMLTAADRKLAKPFVIRSVVARKGATMANFAHGSPLGKNAEGYLRLMNNLYPSGEPQPGQMLKIVE
jgi:predicted Zn-dependent protease